MTKARVPQVPGASRELTTFFHDLAKQAPAVTDLTDLNETLPGEVAPLSDVPPALIDSSGGTASAVDTIVTTGTASVDANFATILAYLAETIGALVANQEAILVALQQGEGNNTIILERFGRVQVTMNQLLSGLRQSGRLAE